MASLSKKIIVACLHCKSLYRVSESLNGRAVACKKCRRTFLASEANIKLSNPEDDGLLLCKIALNYGLVTENKLENTFAEYARLKKNGGNVSMETLLISHGDIDEDTVQLLKSIRDNWDLRLAEKRFAQEAVQKGFISQEKARKALIRQAEIFRESRKVCLLCDMLSDSGDLNPLQCEEILKESERRPIPKAPFSKQQDKTSIPSEPPPMVDPHPFDHSLEPNDDVHKETPMDSLGSSAEESDDAQDTPPATPNNPISPQPVPALKPQMAQHQPETPPLQSDQPSTVPVISEPENKTIPETQPTSPGIQKPDPPEPVEAQDTSEAEHNAPVVESSPETNGNMIQIQGLELVIADDFLTATLRVPEGSDPTTVPLKEIKAALIEEDIVYGISEDSLIKGFLHSKIFREKPFKIAEGIPPKPGKKGSIKFYFDTDYLKIGVITEAGTIDFKNRGEIPYTTEGTLLAEIKPSIQGEQGMDIFGRDIPVQQIQEVYLRCDSGTRQSEDGTKVYAAVNGQPKLNFGNRIQVLSELTIQGDVGFETGHVEFEGNIVIKGSVQNDFIVKGANINVSEATGATIIAKGDLVVQRGISGSTLNIEGNIQAKFIHNCKISAYGNVVAEKEIIDCVIDCSGMCSVEKGKIISSDISAKLGVEALEIGTEMSKPCKLRIGVDDHIRQETDIIEDQILEQKTLLAGLEQTLTELEEKEKNTHKVIAELAHVQDRSQIEQKDINQKIKALETTGDTETIKTFKQQIEELDQKARDADNSINQKFDEQDRIVEEIKQVKEMIIDHKDTIFDLNKQKKDKLAWADSIKGIAYVKTSKKIFTGTVIAGVHTVKTIKETISTARIREIKSPESAEGWEIKST